MLEHPLSQGVGCCQHFPCIRQLLDHSLLTVFRFSCVCLRFSTPTALFRVTHGTGYGLKT